MQQVSDVTCAHRVSRQRADAASCNNERQADVRHLESITTVWLYIKILTPSFDGSMD